MSYIFVKTLHIEFISHSSTYLSGVLRKHFGCLSSAFRGQNVTMRMCEFVRWMQNCQHLIQDFVVLYGNIR